MVNEPDSDEKQAKPAFLDSHVHFWDPRLTPRAVSPLVRTLRFSPRLAEWAARRLFPRNAIEFFGTPKHIVRPYLPETLQNDAGDCPLAGVVHVEAGWEGKSAFGPVGETIWLEQLADTPNTQIKAIVAHADLGMGEKVSEVLEAHLDASHRVRSIRDMLYWHPNARIYNSTPAKKRSANPDWRAGFAQLRRFGLRFDATIYHHQLNELADLATCFPDQPIVLCHLGTPVAVAGPFGGLGMSSAERDRTRNEWQISMGRLAACSNVHVKLSGLLMPVCGFAFRSTENAPSVNEVADAIGPFITFAIDMFGVERCQFASNFPVEKVAVGYATLYNAFRSLVASRPSADQSRLFAENTKCFYGVEC